MGLFNLTLLLQESEIQKKKKRKNWWHMKKKKVKSFLLGVKGKVEKVSRKERIFDFDWKIFVIDKKIFSRLFTISNSKTNYDWQ